MFTDINVPRERIEFLVKIVESFEAQRKELLALSKMIEAEVKKVYFARAKGLERTILAFEVFFKSVNIDYKYNDGEIIVGEFSDLVINEEMIEQMKRIAAASEIENVKKVTDWKEASEDTKGIYEKTILEKVCEYIGAKVFLYALDLSYTYDKETGVLTVVRMSDKEKETFGKYYQIGNMFSEETQRAAGLYRVEFIRQAREKMQTELSKLELQIQTPEGPVVPEDEMQRIKAEIEVRKKAMDNLKSSLEKAAVEYKVIMKNFFARNIELEDLLY